MGVNRVLREIYGTFRCAKVLRNIFCVRSNGFAEYYGPRTSRYPRLIRAYGVSRKFGKLRFAVVRAPVIRL